MGRPVGEAPNADTIDGGMDTDMGQIGDIKTFAEEQGVDPLLLEAMWIVESSKGRDVVGDVGSKRGGSYGPLMVDAENLESFNLTPQQVLDNPSEGIRAGAKQIRRIMELGITDPREIAVWYNGWDVSGKDEGTKAKANAHADKVMVEYRKLQQLNRGL